MSSLRGFRFNNSNKGITVRFSENTKNNAPQPVQNNTAQQGFNKSNSDSRNQQSRTSNVRPNISTNDSKFRAEGTSSGGNYQYGSGAAGGVRQPPN